QTAGGGKREQTWHYPSRAECMVCHSRAANFVLGLCTLQMNKDHAYAAATDNELRTLEHLGVLRVDYPGEAKESVPPGQTETRLQREAGPSSLLTRPPEKYGRLADPYDARADLAARARSYLHANCSQCHVEAGGGNAQIDLEFTTAADKMRVFDVKPQHST